VSKDHPVPRDWPADGVVEFKNYSTRYRPGLDLVLKDISCRVQSGEKVCQDFTLLTTVFFSFY